MVGRRIGDGAIAYDEIDQCADLLADLASGLALGRIAARFHLARIYDLTEAMATFGTSCHDMPASFAASHAKCVNHVREHLSAMSPICKSRRG